jgi:hypothetical protein
LSLRLYLDDCAYSRRPRNILRGVPHLHHVETPIEAGIRGQSDAVHLAYARLHDLILITKDPDDFDKLHRENPIHPGIFAIYEDGDPRDMTDADIGKAVQNLAGSGVPIRDTFHILNRWNY